MAPLTRIIVRQRKPGEWMWHAVKGGKLDSSTEWRGSKEDAITAAREQHGENVAIEIHQAVGKHQPDTGGDSVKLVATGANAAELQKDMERQLKHALDRAAEIALLEGLPG